MFTAIYRGIENKNTSLSICSRLSLELNGWRLAIFISGFVCNALMHLILMHQNWDRLINKGTTTFHCPTIRAHLSQWSASIYNIHTYACLYRYWLTMRSADMNIIHNMNSNIVITLLKTYIIGRYLMMMGRAHETSSVTGMLSITKPNWIGHWSPSANYFN
jgi:hypothetical protein